MTNPNQGQITKQPPRAVSRQMKQRGDLRAGTLGSISESGTAGFARATHCRYGHKFLVGTENRVCSTCGYLERRTDIPPLPPVRPLKRWQQDKGGNSPPPVSWSFPYLPTVEESQRRGATFPGMKKICPSPETFALGRCTAMGCWSSWGNCDRANACR